MSDKIPDHIRGTYQTSRQWKAMKRRQLQAGEIIVEAWTLDGDDKIMFLRGKDLEPMLTEARKRLLAYGNRGGNAS